MSVKVSSWVWHSDESADLMGNELVLMLALADVAGDDGRCRFMDDGSDLTYSALARKVRVDRRTIIRIVAKLREMHLLEQIPGQKGRPNEFTIVVPWVQVTGDNLSPVLLDPVTTATGTGDKSRTRTSLKRIDVVNAQSSFAEFYMAYPRKVGKEAARRAFEKAAKSTDPDVIVAGARRYAGDPNLPDKRFIPYPASWLNAGRWEDEPEVPARVIHAPSMEDFAPGDEWMAFNR